MDNIRLNTKKTIIWRIRVSPYEAEQIKERAKARGYAETSTFIRNLALENSLVIESKINETNKNVREILDIIKNNKISPKL